MGTIVQKGLSAYRKTMQPPGMAAEEPVPQIPEPGLRKTFNKIPPPARILPRTDQEGDSKYRRVAQFLILIGGDQAASVLAELDEKQVEAISREIASIRGIGAEEGAAILAEFRSLFSMPYGYSGASYGGVESARRILYAAYGPEKGEALLNKSLPKTKKNNFDFLAEYRADQIFFLLKDESPAAAALILARLPSKLSAEALGKFQAERKADILLRIAKPGEVAPEVLELVAAGLKEKARHFSEGTAVGGGGKELEIDGMQTLAAILKQGDYAFGDRIISELESADPAIGQNLKEQLYTLDDIILAVDRPVQDKLKSMSDHDIAMLLKGKKPEFSEKILSNVSAARRVLIREESEYIGPVPKRDCDVVAQEFLTWFREARENGDILLLSDEDVIQ